MKIIQLLSVVIFVLLFNQLRAQSDTVLKPLKTGDEWKIPGDAVKRSQAFADKLKVTLGLNDEKTKKVFQVYLANTKPVDEIAVLPLGDKEKADRLKINHMTFNEQLKAILSESEFKKYLSLPVAK